MNQSICIFAFVFILVKFSNSIPLSLTLYNSIGENVEFSRTHTDTSCVNTLIGSVNSQCSTGYWIYSGSSSTSFTIGLNENKTCSRFSSSENYTSVYAVRRLGPEDTTNEAIVFYSGTDVTDYLINQKLADANITVPMNLAASVIITYGSSSWTLFEDNNFNGKMVCLETPDETRLSKMYDSHVNLTSVGSLIKGCDFPHEFLLELRKGVE
ncbi:hypothetical protein HA402_013216 [Bradysia odoriphaga]|nr:hypothetical protein HA402_013216 [Bradysia odoriphaga]